MNLEITEEQLKDWEWRLTEAAIIPNKGYLGITDGDEITEDQFIDLARKVVPVLIAEVKRLEKDVFNTQANYLIPAVNERDRANTKLDRIREVAEPIVQLLARMDNKHNSHIKVDGAPPQSIQTMFPGAKIDGADPFLIDDSVYPKIEAKRIPGGIVCDEDTIRNLIDIIKEPK